MTFKDWFEERLIEVEDDTYLNNLGYGFIGVSKENIKKIYNFFKDDFDMIDFIDIVYCKKCKYKLQYHIVFKNDLICYESLLSLIRLLNTNDALKNMDMELFSRLFVNAHKIDIINDKFYCLMTLNPNHVYPEYIVQFEDYICKYIPEYTDINHLYNVFESELIFNAELNAIIQTNFDILGIVCFKTKEQLEEYKTKTRDNLIIDDDLKPIYEDLKEYVSKDGSLLN